MALLEGKIVIIVDNSPYSLILPSLFLDFFHTTDDYYQKSFNATFIRIIRLIAFFMAIFTPAIYISITTRNYNLVPLPLLLMLKAGRTFVPFPAYIEALFMIICFEILKESDLRMSTTGGSAVSILGGLILGDAAVSAGIVSPIMIIVIAISSIAGLVFNSIELVNVQRTYKIFILILSTILGIYGVFIGFIILLYNIFSTRVFGYKYLEFDKNEVFDSIIKIDRDKCMRNSKLTNNIVRGRYK
jgi:spore germination protein KA